MSASSTTPLPTTALQETTTTAAESTTAVQTTTSTAGETTTSSALPTTTSAAPTTSSAAPTTTSAAPTTTTAPLSTTTAASTTSSEAPSTTSSSAVPTSTTAATTTAVSSSTSAHLSQSVSTGPGGVLVTVTVIPSSAGVTVTSSATSTSTSAPKNSSFFANTGAVAGTFAVVGLVGLSLLAGLIVFLVRKHRARKFDRDVADAAAEANVQAGRNQPYQDDDYDDPYNNSGYPPSSGTHGAYGQPPVAGFDSYDPALVGGAAYPMRDRAGSQSTHGTAGIAGFGARGAYSDNAYTDAQQHYPPADGGHYGGGNMAPSAYPAGGLDAAYGDRSYDPYAPAAAAGAGPGQGLMNPYSHPAAVAAGAAGAAGAASGVQRHQSQSAVPQNHQPEPAEEEDVYGGTAYINDDYSDHEQPHHVLGGHDEDLPHRDSTTSFQDEPYGAAPRVLRVAND